MADAELCGDKPTCTSVQRMISPMPVRLAVAHIAAPLDSCLIALERGEVRQSSRQPNQSAGLNTNQGWYAFLCFREQGAAVLCSSLGVAVVLASYSSGAIVNKRIL